MKVQVTCGCGSVFEAPDHLAGQVIRCPSCRQPLTVPGVQGGADPGGAPAAEVEPDLSDLTSLEQSSLDNSSVNGSTAGRSAIRQAPKRRRKKDDSGGSTVSDKAISQEVDDRMTRLYEVYAGKEMRIKTGGGSKLKLLIGLGIAAATICLGGGVAWHVLNTEYGDALDSMGDIISGESGVETTDVEPVVKARTQARDGTSLWTPSDPARTSGVALTGVDVAVDVSDPDRYAFQVNVVPASKATDRRLSMATAVVLYRSLEADGEFAQVDSVQVEEFDRSTGTLSFKLFDDVPDTLSANLLHYRLSGFDNDSKRLFDTPVGAFAYVPSASVSGGRVTWDLRSTDKPAPAMRLQARLDAPGWEDVLLWRAAADGSMQQVLPDLPKSLPVVIESAVFGPVGIALDGRGAGQWEMAWESETLVRTEASGKQVVGAVPYAGTRILDYRLTPDENSFSSVSHVVGPYDPVGQMHGVGFTPPGSPAQVLTAAAPPGLIDVTATAYNGRVHLGWDGTPLIAGLERYDGTVHIAVHRIDARGDKTRIALLPVESTGFTDTDLQNREAVSYELSLVHQGVSIADAMVRVDAWIDGNGKLPVLVPCPNTLSTVRVVPGPGLDRLYVSLDIPELSYAGTGLPALKLNERLVESLSQAPGVAVVSRAGLRCFVGADTGEILSGPIPGVAGSPAQVQLRLVDSTGPGGDGLALWATDLTTGRSRQLARADADKALEQADLFVTALRTYLESRLPEEVPDPAAVDQAPRLVIVGPIYPLDQLDLNYQAEALTEQLATAGDHASADLSVVSRAFWMNDTRQDPRAIDHESMAGTVLIVGRAWTGEGASSGVSVQAIDAVGGRLIDRFSADRVTPETVRAFAQWCGELRLPADEAPVGDSPLLTTEFSLGPIHPIWREALSDTTGGSAMSSFPGVGTTAEDSGPVLSLGLPLPEALGGLQTLTERKKGHPLYALRPYVAPQHPLTFEQWARAYADYIEADCASFLAGFERIARLQQASTDPIKPYLIIRGEHKYTGEATLPAAAGGMRVTPEALNVRDFFPMGAAGQPMIAYRDGMSEQFQERPWAMSHAWKLVGPVVADPFLKAELFGVEDGRYGRLAFPDKPIPLYTYVAADLLAEIGRGEGHNYRSKALATATQVLNDLVKYPDRRLTTAQMQWSTDALLVLVYERDPGAIQRLSDKKFRDGHFSVDPAMQADVLRMLVDCVGPIAWEWADEFDGIDWDAFCWRSTEEMDTATRAMASLFPEETLAVLRGWLDMPEPYNGQGPDINSFTGLPIGPESN